MAAKAISAAEELSSQQLRKDCHPIRVLSGCGMQTSLGLGQTHGTRLKRFLGHKDIVPYINNDLAMALNNPFKFIH